MNQGHNGSLLRKRDGGHARVSFAELFFDLVFVFAVTQLSHGLLAHPGVEGLAQTGMLFLAVWWTWIYTAWSTNWLDPDRAPVRLLLFALMAAGLAMAIAIPHAFDSRGALFAVAFAAMQVGRPLFVMLAMRGVDRANQRNFARIMVWGALAAVLWLWGGFAEPGARPAIWGAALALELVSPAAGFFVPGLGASRSTDWTIEGAHVAERCGLFVIIALGESILITGATFAEAEWRAAVLTGFASAFLATVAMWWIYFNIGAERASEHIAHAADPGRVARLAYTYLHLPIGAGIVLTAASDELVLAHPTGHTDPFAAMCLVGGPALYLLGCLLFKRATWGRWPVSHVAGLAMLAGVGSAWQALEPAALSAATTGVLILVALWETLSFRGSRRPPANAA
ncbi:low temperature requirement protein A [Sphingomonas canadensis]|uniref:Low temperature requirement protein A n=1 Tax=Sphingomonas canadensis TaxID=1219257 RepID=A0ABW3H1E2_9SPHN|nr:low temperature requirement protein A [Sphingomonas canadensis]MCW3835121.1 low temperature requirement protein A [Sphingomonas canadensis]